MALCEVPKRKPAACQILIFQECYYWAIGFTVGILYEALNQESGLRETGNIIKCYIIRRIILQARKYFSISLNGLNRQIN